FLSPFFCAASGHALSHGLNESHRLFTPRECVTTDGLKCLGISLSCPVRDGKRRSDRGISGERNRTNAGNEARGPHQRAEGRRSSDLAGELGGLVNTFLDGTEIFRDPDGASDRLCPLPHIFPSILHEAEKSDFIRARTPRALGLPPHQCGESLSSDRLQ